MTGGLSERDDDDWDGRINGRKIKIPRAAEQQEDWARLNRGSAAPVPVPVR